MSEKKVPEGLLATDEPDLFFEDNTVGRLKKEVWDASDAEIDAILAEYGVPSPVEWGKPGSYIQTTVRWQVEENRQQERHRLCAHRLHRAARRAPAQRLGYAVRQPDPGGRAPLHGQAGRSPSTWLCRR